MRVEGWSILEDTATAIDVTFELLHNGHPVDVLLVTIHSANVNVRVVAHVAFELVLGGDRRG